MVGCQSSDWNRLPQVRTSRSCHSCQDVSCVRQMFSSSFVPWHFLAQSLCALSFSFSQNVHRQLLQSLSQNQTRGRLIPKGLWRTVKSLLQDNEAYKYRRGKCATVRVELPAHVEDKINVCYTFSSSFVCDVRDISALCCRAFMASRDKITSCYFLCWLFKIMSV